LRLFPDDFTAGYFQNWKYNLNQPVTIDLAVDFRQLVNSFSPERLLIGEIFSDDATIGKYMGRFNDGLYFVFLWDHIAIEPNADFLRKVLRIYERLYPEPAAPVYVFGNHDCKRLMSRIG
jgi:alpha-glucosidase